MATHYTFDDDKIGAALEAARQVHSADVLAERARSLDPADDGHLSISGGCIAVTVEDGKICLELPLGIGKYCLPIPSVFPDGTAAQACIHICTTWGIPTGVRVTVSIAGHVVIEKTFLKC